VRIGIVSDTYTPQVNGVTTVVRRIVELLRRQGHACAVVAPRYPLPTQPAEAAELRAPSLPFPLYPAIRVSLPQFRRVTEFLDAFQPDLLHVHTEGPLGLVGRRYAVRRGLPLVTSFHTNFPAYSRHYGFGALAPAVWRWLRWFHQPARRTLTPGVAIRADLERRGLRDVVLWGRGVDTTLFHPAKRDWEWRRRLAGGDDTTVVLHVGRLAREKNLDVLIKAWELAYKALGQRATFVVAGEGGLAQRIESRLPFVRRLGFLSRQDLAVVYASADLCVFPSVTETCGLVALEAMASGVPVIAADAGGFRENVVPNTTGVLVSPHDPRGFLDAIARLVVDRGRRCGLAAAARLHALTHDVAREDAELLDHYAALVHPAPEAAACVA
jgi:phosphatidylinositol alpha 1,6-mannosyltransferase